MDYPRTLIVGAHPSEQSGVGMYLRMLFSGWPIDRLATVCEGPLAPDWQRCSRYYQVGHLEHRLSPPFRWLAPPAVSGAALPPSTNHLPGSITTPSRIALGRRIAQIPWRLLLGLLGGGETLCRVAASPEVLAWIAEFQPEVIYGHCSFLNTVRFLRELRESLRLPLVLHLMDDWPENLYRDGSMSRRLRPRYLTEFTALMQASDVTIAICPEMAGEYENRYRREVLSLPMPVELDGFRSAARTQWGASRPFRIRYGGRVGWAVDESLADVARAVEALCREGTGVVFDLATFQTAKVPAVCRGSTGVNVLVPGPASEVPARLAEADALLICYDFDARSYRQARYSMPSKLPACLASGTPILVYGPAGLPVVEYARREGWGQIVDRRDSSALKGAIEALIGSGELRERLGRKARQLAIQFHDAQAVSDQLRAILVAAMQQHAEAAN